MLVRGRDVKVTVHPWVAVVVSSAESVTPPRLELMREVIVLR